MCMESNCLSCQTAREVLQGDFCWKTFEKSGDIVERWMMTENTAHHAGWMARVQDFYMRDYIEFVFIVCVTFFVDH